MLKKLLLISFLSTSLVFPVFAQGDKYGTSETQLATGGLLPTSIKGATKVPELIGILVSIILGVLGIVFFGLIFWAGFNWMTAQGNSEKIDRSKDTITSAAIGLVVVFAAYALTSFVFKSLDISSSNGVNSPAIIDDSRCVAINGNCLDRNFCESNGGNIRTGLCPGGVDNICCTF